MNKLGIQWQIESEAVQEYNRLVQTRALMGINSYSLEFWQRLQADNPQSLRIFRFWPNFDKELGLGLDQPDLLAVESAKFLKRKIAHLAITGAITHVLGMNEWVHSFEHGKHPLADRFMASFIPAVRQEVGLPVIVLNAACGHYAGETADLFPLTLTKLAQEVDLPPQQKSFLGFHEYDYPTMDRIHQEDLARGGGGYWLCGKWKRIMPRIHEYYGPIQAIITEAGVDGGVVGLHGKGFRNTAPGLDSAARQYCGNRSLYWYKRLLDEDAAVYAAIIFGLSMHSDWGDFDIKGTEVPKFISQMPNWEPEPEPNGGNKMSLEGIRVFKLSPLGGHTELTTSAEKEALIYGKYGAAFRRAKVAEGQKVYRLAELWEKTGHSSLITNVVDGDGKPMKDVAVTFYWSGAPRPPEPATPVYGNDWYDRFIWGLTNINGDVGPGMGKGAYHAEGEGGPHAVWIHDPDIPSDICEKLGMLAGTFHDHLDQKFQLETGGDTPDLPDPDDFEIREVIVEEDKESNMLYIAYPAEISVNTDTHASSCAQPDLDTTPLEAYQYDGRDYARGGVCADFAGAEERLYVIYAYHLKVGPDRPITPSVSASFAALGTAPKNHITIVVDWKAEPPPPPPPPPPKWSMKVEAKPGLSLLIGRMPRAGIQVTVTDPRGPVVKVVSGSKTEHGVGGWEVNAWGRGIYIVEFEDQKFQVPVEGQTVVATFEEGEQPAQARLVSTWMDQKKAEGMLQILEDELFPGIFSLES